MEDANTLKPKEKNEVWGLVKTIFYFLLIGLLLLYILLELFMPDKTARIMQIKAYYVETDSMKPTLDPYDMIFITAPRNIKEGDIITYRGPLRVWIKEGNNYSQVVLQNQVITHRVTRYDEEAGGWRTKGDNAKDEDIAVVKQENIIGKYVGHIPKIGYVYAFITSTLGMIVLVINIGVIVGIVYIYKTDKKKRLLANNDEKEVAHDNDN